jgi:hypothetical protein
MTERLLLHAPPVPPNDLPHEPLGNTFYLSPGFQVYYAVCLATGS